MTIAIDMDTHLASNLLTVGQQGLMNNGIFAKYMGMVFVKDMTQSGQEANAGMFAAFNEANRTPVVKTSGTTTA